MLLLFSYYEMKEIIVVKTKHWHASTTTTATTIVGFDDHMHAIYGVNMS